MSKIQVKGMTNGVVKFICNSRAMNTRMSKVRQIKLFTLNFILYCSQNFNLSILSERPNTNNLLMHAFKVEST